MCLGHRSRNVELKAFKLTLFGSDADQTQFTELLLKTAARDHYEFVINMENLVRCPGEARFAKPVSHLHAWLGRSKHDPRLVHVLDQLRDGIPLEAKGSVKDGAVVRGDRTVNLGRQRSQTVLRRVVLLVDRRGTPCLCRKNLVKSDQEPILAS